jgi:hypothetical protein
LLDRYDPTAVEVWHLGNALRYLELAGSARARQRPQHVRRRSVAVVGSQDNSLWPQLAFVAACEGIDVLLTLVKAVGGDHVSGWATRAVPMVTAGGSSAPRIGAVGDMIRLVGVQLVSAVLLVADETDETLASVGGRG